MREGLEALLLANVAAGIAVLAVLVLRRPARRWFGPQVAYALWLLPPVAALATLAPARVVIVQAPMVVAAAEAASGIAAAGVAAPSGPPIDVWSLAAALWIVGVAASAAGLAWRQMAFARAARAGLAGPAAVGVLRPRIITPADFDARYTVRERQVVLAHEAAHIARHDPRINALVAAARCLNWFNPALHLLAHFQRIDQELACDAAVVAAHPNARRSYAEAMLKTQLAVTLPPLGCAWLSPGAHPLAERVRLLGEPGPERAQRRLGAAVVALLALGAAGAAWAGKPANFVAVEPSLTEPVPAARPPVKATPPPAPSRRPLATDRAVVAPAPAPASEAIAALAAADADTDAGAVPPVATEPPRPARRIFAAANRSRVQPGAAVRVVATTVDPGGRPLMTDLTAFGSQHYYRTGAFIRDGSPQVLFTSVVQDGETFWVTASTNRRFQAPGVATAGLRSGETRDLVTGDGQVITVTATARAETPEEVAGARDHLRRVNAEIDQSARTAWAILKGEAARERVRCRREACRVAREGAVGE
jgi:beta-lactamase regulating signal transducer with metallopeptidase domain